MRWGRRERNSLKDGFSYQEATRSQQVRSPSAPASSANLEVPSLIFVSVQGEHNNSGGTRRCRADEMLSHVSSCTGDGLSQTHDSLSSEVLYRQTRASADKFFTAEYCWRMPCNALREGLTRIQRDRAF